MKATLALLLFVCPVANAATFATGTRAFYATSAGELVDATGNFANMVETGSVPSNSTPTTCASTGSFYGHFSTGNYYEVPAALLTEIKAYTTYSIEMCVWFSSFGSAPVTVNDESTNYVQFNAATGIPRWGSSGGILGPSGTAVSLSTATKVLITFDGTNKRIYLNDTLVQGPSAQAASWSGATRVRFGTGFSCPVAGFISSIRIMNIAATPPIVDAAPSYRQQLRIQNWMKFPLSYQKPPSILVMLGELFAPQELHASWVDQIKQRLWEDNQEPVKREKVLSKVPTAAPTALTKTTFTPTPAITATPTPVIK